MFPYLKHPRQLVEPAPAQLPPWPNVGPPRKGSTDSITTADLYATTSDSTVRVNCTQNWAKGDLRQKFSQFGAVDEIKMWSVAGRSGMFADIRFKSVNATSKALAAVSRGGMVGFQLELSSGAAFSAAANASAVLESPVNHSSGSGWLPGLRRHQASVSIVGNAVKVQPNAALGSGNISFGFFDDLEQDEFPSLATSSKPKLAGPNFASGDSSANTGQLDDLLSSRLPSVDQDVRVFIRGILVACDDVLSADGVFDAVGELISGYSKELSEADIRKLCYDLHEVLKANTGKSKQLQSSNVPSPLQHPTSVQKQNLSTSSASATKLNSFSHCLNLGDATTELSDVSPALARFGNLRVVAKLISTKFEPQAVKASVKENGAKMEFTGTEEVLSSLKSWLANEANVFGCRPYVISHPLMAYLLNQPSHSNAISQIERTCGCIIVPADRHVDFASSENSFGHTEVKLTDGHAVKIVNVNGDISCQNVDVILKPVFRASDFANLRSHCAQHGNAVAQRDTTLLAEASLLLCKRVLYALFEDTASSSFSFLKADNRFFSKCLEVVRSLRAKTLAIPVEGLRETNLFHGSIKSVQSAVVDALKALLPVLKLELKEIRLVQSSVHPATSASATAIKAKPRVVAKVETISYPPPSAQLPVATLLPNRPVDQTVLNLANGVKVSLVQDDIANVDAHVLVSSTQEGKGDLSHGGASCKAIFAAGGPNFLAAVKSLYPSGLPAGMDCGASFARYGSLKCSSVVHVALPASPKDDAKAEQIIKSKAAACLEAASGGWSIAFPVIGAGGLGYPASLVAKRLLAAAVEWALSRSDSPLKDIRFVVHPSDQTSMLAFQDVFRNHSLPDFSVSPSAPSALASEPSATLAAFKLGLIEVKLDQTQTDISGEHLLLASSQDDVKFASEWLDTLMSALMGADRYRVQSVLVPLQQGGLAAITPDYLADLFFAACVKFEATSPCHLRTLRPYLENSTARQAFTARMTELAREAEVNQRSWSALFIDAQRSSSAKPTEMLVRQLNELEAKLANFGINEANQPRLDVDVTEYSFAQSPGDYIIYGKADGIAKAIGMLDNIQTPLTKDSCQIRFDRKAKGFAQTITPPNADFCIASQPGTTAAATFLALVGDALMELTQPELVDNPHPLPKDVVWYLQTPDDAWHSFGRTEATALEHLAKSPIQERREAHFAYFDFCQLPTVTVGNCAMRLVRKTDHIPVHWISTDEDTHRMHLLDAQSSEYKDILAIVQRSNTKGRKVMQIQRIENRTLFKQYLTQKEKLTKNCPIGHIVERDLFHGTSKEHLDGICADGFDRSRAGQSVGAMYGNGSYFSTSFDYSSNRGLAREGHIFYCKVLVGESVQGKHGLSVLPYKPGSTFIKYDSAVDDLQNPSIYVIFADYNAYPAYLITLAIKSLLG